MLHAPFGERVSTRVVGIFLSATTGAAALAGASPRAEARIAQNNHEDTVVSVGSTATGHAVRGVVNGFSGATALAYGGVNNNQAGRAITGQHAAGEVVGILCQTPGRAIDPTPSPSGPGFEAPTWYLLDQLSGNGQQWMRQPDVATNDPVPSCRSGTSD